MSAIGISSALFIVLFAALLLYRIMGLKPGIAGIRSQKMCPSCGLITSRLKFLHRVWHVFLVATAPHDSRLRPNGRAAGKRNTWLPSKWDALN
jgi:hypothetical protein